ncbi:MAG: hypothetical protein DMG76_10190 [Acidobacteria bacterium]|nr:MAG: hypothetical protein DMG76_10190 [Acidobacteriota bacterium]
MTGYGLNPRNTAFPFGMWTLSRVVLPVLLTVAGDQEADSDRWIHYCVSSRDKATRMTCKTRKESILALAVALTVKLNRVSKWKISCLAGLAMLGMASLVPAPSLWRQRPRRRYFSDKCGHSCGVKFSLYSDGQL